MASEIQRISTNASGVEGDRGGYEPAYSPNGTRVVFSSPSTNLVAGDTNDETDIFVKDLATGVVTLVSVNTAGVQGDGYSVQPVFSPDGSKVAFLSSASNLVPDDTNELTDIFVKDLITGAITRISTSGSGAQSSNVSTNPVFSPDGTKIAFLSVAKNLVPNDTNDGYDIFVKHLSTGAIQRVSTSASGGQANSSFFFAETMSPVFSPDGTKIAFFSAASNLVPGDNNVTFDVFVKNLDTGAITRASTDQAGVEAKKPVGIDYNSFPDHRPAFSPDGRKIAFHAPADNLVPGDTNGSFDIFVKDLITGAITRVSTNASGVEGDRSSFDPIFSADGGKIAFRSESANLVADDTNSLMDVFIKDLATGAITRVSTDAAGREGNGASPEQFIVFSPDGGEIAFVSRADNLVPGDTNNDIDIFVKSILVAPVAGADAYTTYYDAPFTVDAAHGLLANDGDANEDALTATLVQGPAHGTISLDAVGSFTYTPDGTFVGIDRFTYRATDGSLSSPDTTVSVTVNGNIIRVSTTASGAQVGYPGSVTSLSGSTPRFLPDGRVAFASQLTNLVPGDTNGVFLDIFIKDPDTDEITLATAGSNSHSSTPAFSADGRYMVFFSSADNLVAGDTNQTSDIFVEDLATGEITRVSTSAAGAQANASSFLSPAISADGGKVAFASFATNLVAGDTGLADIFVKDLTTGAVTRVTADGQGGVLNPVFSPDGTKLAFESSGSNLIPGDPLGGAGIFVADLTTGDVTRVSTSAVGAPANSFSIYPVFSPDGNKVAFYSDAANLVPGDTLHSIDLFLKDLTTGAINFVSTDAAGNRLPVIGVTNSAPAFSPDGTQIAFALDPYDPLDTSIRMEIYVKDLVTGNLRQVSMDSFEVQESDGAYYPVFSPDGKKVAFESFSSNLVPGDTNNRPDIFVKDLTRFPIGSQPVAPPVPSDFNADHRSDILLQHTNGQAAIWEMNGTHLTRGAYVGANPGPSWTAIDTGDFNSDGKSDILWQNNNGAVAIWELDGTNIIGMGVVGSNPGTDWKAISTGDFNGDGTSDILLQHTNGQAAIWELDGTNISAGAYVGANPGTSWQVKGTGDFNGDHKSDILWQNTDGAVGIWELDGANVLQYAAIGPNPGMDWKAIGTGDFNGDGKSDILWQNTDGAVGIWELDGSNVLEYAAVGANPGTSWKASDTGDYNGDGKSDILWQNTNGAVGIWELDGTSLVAAGLAGAPGADWLVV